MRLLLNFLPCRRFQKKKRKEMKKRAYRIVHAHKNKREVTFTKSVCLLVCVVRFYNRQSQLSQIIKTNLNLLSLD